MLLKIAIWQLSKKLLTLRQSPLRRKVVTFFQRHIKFNYVVFMLDLEHQILVSHFENKNLNSLTKRQNAFVDDYNKFVWLLEYFVFKNMFHPLFFLCCQLLLQNSIHSLRFFVFFGHSKKNYVLLVIMKAEMEFFFALYHKLVWYQ